MSGPIVRKYGFPNFEKIFGERGLEHGADEAESPPAGTPKAPAEPEGRAKEGGPDDPATPSGPSKSSK